MKDPLAQLKQVISDPVELTSITLPSAALVILFYSFRERIHPALMELPDLHTNELYGGILFFVTTLFVSVLLKAISHDLLNWIYDKSYREHRRRDNDTWYARAQMAGLLSGDKRVDNYSDTLKMLAEVNDPAVGFVKMLQTQSKFARSISLILCVFAGVFFFQHSYLVSTASLALGAYMLYTFFKFRWQASEKVYEALVNRKTTR